ncbi:MAG TPA: PTS sugar transporter subunit IIB [bacterium]|nr:PTS sugar transporter subunit IIB [bacterium]
MDIQLLRIDDRLIHGQVVVGWVKALGIQRLVVVNDPIAGNSMQRTLMEMAVPSGLKVSFFSVAEAAQKCREDMGPEKALLLFSNPKDVLAYLGAGGTVSSINVGGMHYCEGKQQVSKTVCVSPEDVGALVQLRKMGVELEVRAVPGDTKEMLEKFIPDLKGL